MQSSVWFRYLFGQASAIRNLAAERRTLWTGIALVFLTAIARNYDQTFIAEKPFLWFFGPLLFSVVSGSWLYVIVYGFARRGMNSGEDEKTGYWSGWRSFMGLFWMTAPIAWLYAIPVERLFDSVTAAKANVALLAVVSFWRVLLMARVMQVTTKAPFLMSLLWVLLAASVEVVIVVFLGGGFARTIMASMGGMRNSPEEEILLSAMSNAFGVAFWAVPITLVLAFVLHPNRQLIPLPKMVSGKIAWLTLTVLAVFWIAVAIVPQQELAKSVTVEKLMASGKSREALDYLSRHQPDDFAPARTLPPKPYETSLFEKLPDCFDAGTFDGRTVGEATFNSAHGRNVFSLQRPALRKEKDQNTIFRR